MARHLDIDGASAARGLAQLEHDSDPHVQKALQEFRGNQTAGRYEYDI
jgi:hypothetical protein